jgi:hypothetical protein
VKDNTNELRSSTNRRAGVATETGPAVAEHARRRAHSSCRNMLCRCMDLWGEPQVDCKNLMNPPSSTTRIFSPCPDQPARAHAHEDKGSLPDPGAAHSRAAHNEENG